MNSVASVLCDSSELPAGEVDTYLTNVVEDHVCGMNEQYDFYGINQHESVSSDPLFFENGFQMSFDGSCYSDYSGSVYSGSCYGTNDSNLYPDLSNSLYSNVSYSASEQDLNKYSIDTKYSMESNYSMEGKYSMESNYSMDTKYSIDSNYTMDSNYTIDSKYSMESNYTMDNKYTMDTKYGIDNNDLMSHSGTPGMQYLTPKLKPKFEYPLAGMQTGGSTNPGNMPSAVPGVGSNASLSSGMMDILSPSRSQPVAKKVTTQDLALFNSLMDGNVLTPMRSSTGVQGGNMKKTASISSATTTSTLPYSDNYNQYYHFDEKSVNSPYYRQMSINNQRMDSMVYQPELSESPGGQFGFKGERESVSEGFFAPASVTTSVVTSFTVPSFEPGVPAEERYREILKVVLKSAPASETFLSPMSAQVLASESVGELAAKYDESQRSESPPETHVVYVRSGSDLSMVLRNDNLLIQYGVGRSERGEQLKLSKQTLSSKNVASSADLNECMARARNDEGGASYLPSVSCNWKGVHETSWWMGDERGAVRNFKVRFDPAVFGSKALALEEANRFAKFVEGLIRPGALISWYPGFNIPIGTSGRANLRKVLHMDRMKNAELCDPVLEANGLKVAAKSTFGDMIIVELYKAAYVLGLWDVAAYNCLKTCKRRGYAFEWIREIQASGKRITVDALKYMRNVKELVEQDKISRVNCDKKRRRKKVPDKRRKN